MKPLLQAVSTSRLSVIYELSLDTERKGQSSRGRTLSYTRGGGKVHQPRKMNSSLEVASAGKIVDL